MTVAWSDNLRAPLGKSREGLVVAAVVLTASAHENTAFGRDFEHRLDELHIRLLRPARKDEAERTGSQLFKPLRQVIESVNETFKGQLDLERHHGRTAGGVMIRVLQRIFALTAVIWHNDRIGQPTMRSHRLRSLTPLESII